MPRRKGPKNTHQEKSVESDRIDGLKLALL